ncbi:hypothetical protein IMSAG249_00749 [Lachnospiraceae bacterium]|jgi:hypothetical protein|nr:hypothetical protein IMSAG249_00749 [Lachnospiraceae bacterium]
MYRIYIIFAVYFIILFAVIHFLSKRARKRQAQKEGIPEGAVGNPGFGMAKKAYTKEQRILVKEQFRVYRKKIYEDYPQVDKFETVKRRWIGGMLLGGLLLTAGKALVLRESMGVPVMALLFSVLTAFGVYGIFLLCAMGPKWKLSGFLYLLAVKDIMTYAHTLFVQGGIDSWERFCWVYIDGFQEYPLAVSLDFLSWLYTLLILATAVWLTLVPKNRELAGQSEILQLQLKKFTPDI